VHAPNAALLIDFDNVTLGIQKDLTKELRTLLNSDIIKGKVAVQRAYADWRRYPQYIVSLSESSIDLIFAPAFGSTKKNATDIRLAIDAIELVFTRPEIGTFILLSGDSDFSTMVIKLKEYGKYVIGVGIRESASDLLIQNCDEYYSYNDLAGLTKEVDTPSVQRDPWELAGQAVAQMARNGDVMRSDRLKQVMQQIDPNFDERNAGFNRFSKFVLEAGQRGVVTVTKLENGQFEVTPGTVAVVPPAPPAVRSREAADGRDGREGREDGGRARRGRRGRGRGERSEGGREPAGREPAGREPAAARAARPADGSLSLARAFQLMSQSLDELRGPVGQEALRLRMAALHGREDPLLDPSRFPRLLRQANDAEIADVRKVGEDDYEISGRRVGGSVPSLAAAPAAPPAPPADAEPASAEPGNAEPVGETPAAAAAKENGQRFGVRFRRGSRGGLRTAEFPLIGVVRIDEPAEAQPAGADAEIVPGATEEAAAKPARPRRAPRKKAATTAAKAAKSARSEAPAEPAKTAAEPPVKRPRARARKKAE
jgi:uncharacterized protein (TIGR00288 family)